MILHKYVFSKIENRSQSNQGRTSFLDALLRLKIYTHHAVNTVENLVSWTYLYLSLFYQNYYFNLNTLSIMKQHGNNEQPLALCALGSYLRSKFVFLQTMMLNVL